MHFAVVTLFPEMFSALTQEGVIARGIASSKLSLSLYSIRDFSDNAYRRVDDQPYGGGPGMVLMAEPIALAIEAAKKDLRKLMERQQPDGLETSEYIKDPVVIYLSPRGERFVQSHVPRFLAQQSCIFVCGRYEGVDQRVLDELVDHEVSIGDFVLSGGELPAMVLMDAIARHIPGVLGNAESPLEESFMKTDEKGGYEYDHSQYTRPRVWRGKAVPEVLLNGNHQKIKAWRNKKLNN
jgi:tRNA (guanine37-N1)-methyltransferase